MSYTLAKCPVCDLHTVKLSQDEKGGYLPLDPFECIQAQNKRIESFKENILSLTKFIADTNERFKQLEKQTALVVNELRKQIQEL